MIHKIKRFEQLAKQHTGFNRTMEIIKREYGKAYQRKSAAEMYREFAKIEKKPDAYKYTPKKFLKKLKKVRKKDFIFFKLVSVVGEEADNVNNFITDEPDKRENMSELTNMIIKVLEDDGKIHAEKKDEYVIISDLVAVENLTVADSERIARERQSIAISTERGIIQNIYKYITNTPYFLSGVSDLIDAGLQLFPNSKHLQRLKLEQEVLY